MSLCDALALLIGLFGGFYSVVCASRDWFEHKFPVKEEELNGVVATIKKQHQAGATGGQDCETVAASVKSSMKLHRICLLTPTVIFLVCMTVCAFYACSYYDDIKANESPKWLKTWFIRSVQIFGTSMLLCWIFALIFRIKANTGWDKLGRDLKWVPNEEEYESIKPVSSGPKPQNVAKKNGRPKSGSK